MKRCRQRGSEKKKKEAEGAAVAVGTATKWGYPGSEAATRAGEKKQPKRRKADRWQARGGCLKSGSLKL